VNHREAGRYWDGNAEAWSELSRAGYNTSRDRVLNPCFCEILPNVHGLAGLDIGCGDGDNTTEGGTDPMPMTQQQANKLTQWLQSKGVRGACSACGKNNWAPGGIVSAPEFTGHAIAIGGPSVPMAQLVCGNCGHVMLFAAVPIGLVQ
jgi:hypothetical protein